MRKLIRGLWVFGFCLLSQNSYAQLAILDSWEKIEYADSADFKTSASVRLSKNEPIGYVIRLANDDDMPTGTFTRLYKMVPITVSVPSYSGGQTGTFYDAVVPLLSANLAGTVYVYAEYDGNASAGPQTITFTQSGSTVTLNVTVVDNTLAPNTKPLYMGMVNIFLTYGHYTEYIVGSEGLGVLYSQMLVDHRVFPIGNWVSEPPINAGRINYDSGSHSWRNEVLQFAPGEDKFDMWDWVDQAHLEAAEVAVTEDNQTGVWFFTCDEPGAGGASISTCNSWIATEELYAPSIKTMVTKYIGSGVVGNDIYCPVIDWFGVGAGDPFTYEADYAGKELWLYTSCMEHGCSSDQNANPGAPKFSGSASGMPGMVLDHTTAHIYAFVGMPIRYSSVQALLYYNAVEGHRLYRDGVAIDIWTDQFNFGGNGDGALMYPLRNGMFGNTGENPAGSIRLKTIRSAEYMMDYVEQASPAQEAACNASALITDTNTFELDADVWRAFRECLLDELGFIDEGQPNLRNLAIRSLDTKASFTVGMQNLPYESNCVVVIKASPGGATIDTITSTEGLAVRTLVNSVSLTASTNYTAEQSCEGANTDAQLYSFTTLPTPTGGDRTISISAGDNLTYSTASRATVEYDDNPALSSSATLQNISCTTGCTISPTLAAGFYYHRWIWQNDANATLAIGTVQPLLVP